MKRRRPRCPQSIDQPEPDHRRGQPRYETGIDEGKEQRPAGVQTRRLEQQRRQRQRDTARQHLQAHDHQEIPARGRAAHQQRRCRQRHHAQAAKQDAGQVHATAQPGAHDDEHADHPGQQPRHPQRPQPFAQKGPGGKADQQGHG